MRQNPHVRICGGPGSATTLVYPTPHGPPRRAGRALTAGLSLRNTQPTRATAVADPHVS